MPPQAPVEIAIGQIYRDKDARRIERHVRVLQITDTVREC